MFGKHLEQPRKDAASTVTVAPSLPLSSIALAAIAQSLPRELIDKTPRLHALRDLALAADACGGWKPLLVQAESAPCPHDEMQFALADILGLSDAELLTVALAIAVEHDIETAELMTLLQQPIARAHPAVGLLTRALAIGDNGSPPVFEALLGGVALRSGLLLLGEGSASYGERSLRVPIPLVLALRGGASNWPGTTSGIDENERVPLAQSEQAALRAEARAMPESGERRLVLRAGSLREARSAAAQLARELHLTPLFLSAGDESGLGVWLCLHSFLPVHSFTLGPGERRPFPDIAFYTGPALALLGPDGDLESPSGMVVTCKLATPPPGEREDLWLEHTESPALARELASHYRLRSGRIADLARLAKRRAALDGRSGLQSDDVYRAARSGETTGLSSLAELIDCDIPDDALIVPPVLRRDLQMLCFRCQARENLADDLGASVRGRYRPGVLALFFGPSGTGKTLGALWLASRLRLPVYRVDLASITSKYVGETERNLSRLLTDAEQAGVVLLFDEADSIFGRRTEVRDSNDRFANAQTNYLLQRMENFDGIAILTSNSRSRLDTSFFRRIETVLEFPLPDPAQRRALWQAHLGNKHQLTQSELNHFALAADLTGGDIRNVVLAAATGARVRQANIGAEDVLLALTAEYRKLGRHLPDGLARPTQ